MTANLRRTFDRVFQQLETDGLLLVWDNDFPNIARILSPRDTKGSWWSRPDGKEIFLLSEMLEDHPDVLVMKLVKEKVTFVHRELWGRIYSIGTARDEWQLKKLTPAAKKLLKLVDTEGVVQTNQLAGDLGPKPGDIARELEGRMLVRSSQVHTNSGAHTKVLETWEVWARRIGYKVRAKSAQAACSFLEARVESINPQIRRGVLPWQTNR